MKSFWGGRRLAGRDAVSAAIGLSVVLFSGCTLFLGAFKIKCGDGFLQEPEACDDGNQTSESNCIAPFCGNGIVDNEEECDDGNTTSGDGCESTCVSGSTCGNNVADTGEFCGFTIQVINNPAFQEPISLTAADFIQGGPNELAIANAENNTVAILSKNAGTFNVSTIAVGVNPNQVIAAELSTGGSDIADLVVVCNGGSIDLLDGNGDGTFTGNSLISTQPLSAAVGDVDLDGDPDLFFTEQTTNSFSFFLDGGLGNGQSFTTLASPPVDITVGSFRGATLDVAVLGRTTGSVDIFLNNGISFPSAPNQTITGLSGPNALAQGDLNEDSLIDLVVAEGLSNRISVFNGLGCTANACFTPTGIPAFTGNNPSSVVVGDLDRDGQLDVVTANLDSGTVSVLLNLGTGSFQAKQDFSIGTAEAPSDVVLADLDNDGVLDLATTNFTSENITIFLGKK